MFIRAITSDPHYGHKNIIQYANRPFESVHHMNESMIENYNSMITKDDIVLWCGDCFFCPKEDARKIMDRLNGRKILVLGNHDRSAGSMAGIGFDIVMNEFVMVVGGRVVRVCHYPYARQTKDERYLDRRPEKIKGELLIHGHTHSHETVNGTSIHVGVDSWNYRPALMNEIESIINERFSP